MPMRPLPRRTFLRGAGVAFALPFLEAMLPINRSWAAEPPKFALLYKGIGSTSEPSNTTSVKTIHNGLRSLISPWDNYATYITGLINDGITDNHYEIAGFMSGNNTSSYKLETSIDLVMADLLGQGSVFKNLYVGSESRPEQSSTLQSSLSQRKGTQSTLYSDPRKLFDLITTLGGFKSTGSTPTTVDPLKRDVLSLSLDSIKSLQRELSSSDKAVLDKHLTAIEQIQNAMATGQSAAAVCTAPTVAASYASPSPSTKLPIIADIAAVALNCDLTRSLSFLVFPDGAGSTVSHVDLYDEFQKLYGTRPGVGYHEWTHKRWLSPSNTSNTNTTKCQGAMLEADKWDYSVVARFLKGLNANVLDSSVVAFGSGGSYNGQHPISATGNDYHSNIPFVLFGKLGGQLKPKGATPIYRQQSIANVWLTLLQKLGSNAATFGKIRDINKTVDLS